MIAKTFFGCFRSKWLPPCMKKSSSHVGAFKARLQDNTKSSTVQYIVTLAEDISQFFGACTMNRCWHTSRYFKKKLLSTLTTVALASLITLIPIFPLRMTKTRQASSRCFAKLKVFLLSNFTQTFLQWISHIPLANQSYHREYLPQASHTTIGHGGSIGGEPWDPQNQKLLPQDHTSLPKEAPK